MSRTGKCNNFSGCLLAYRGEETSVADGQPFVCAECGKPLAEVKAPAGRWMAYAAAGLVAVALLATLAIVLPRIVSKKKAAGTTPPTQVEPGPAQSSEPATAESEEMKNPAEPPPAAVPEKELRLSVDQAVKAEVLKRVDLSPLTGKEKDRLYTAVDKARKMGLIITVPFAKGKALLAPDDAQAIKAAFEAPEIAKMRENYSTVFVVLGYADPKGDAKANLKTSRDRADAVVTVIEKDFGPNILVRALGMGGTTLLDANNLEKNRIAEVWVVQP